MLFDLLQVATNMGCSMESLLSGVQQQQHQLNQSNSSTISVQDGGPNQSTQATRRRHRSSHQHQQISCQKPLDLSLKTASYEPISCKSSTINDQIDSPLDLVAKQHQIETCASSTPVSPLSCSLFTSNSIRNSLCLAPAATDSIHTASNGHCDKTSAQLSCDLNNNNNYEETRTSTSEVQISSTNGRRQQRRRRLQTRQNQQQNQTKAATTSTKSHLCNHCGRFFSRSDMLTRHSRLHSGLKPYQCGKCLQVFSRSDHLSTHERTHTGEKPYQCHLCPYSACRRDMITRHMKTHTSGRISGSNNKSRSRGKTRRHSSMESSESDGQQQLISQIREDDVSTSADTSINK